LYNGEVELLYDDRRHLYLVREGEALVKVPSVTTVLAATVDKSGPLKYWAVNETLSYLRGVLKPDECYDSYTLEAILSEAKKAHNVKKQEAADIGTQAHKALEAYFKQGQVYELPVERDEQAERVGHCFAAAQLWLGTHNVEKVAVERKIYSRKYKYSGTLDKLAYVDGILCLIDWKSSNDIYPEHKLQTAAYVAAYEEETGEQVRERWLIKLGKDTGEFEPHRLSRAKQNKDFTAFKHALGLYKWLKTA
jgi:hypothetical protein